MANKIWMNLNTYVTISERLYPGAVTDPDYALWQEENQYNVLVNQFVLPNCDKKYWKRTYSTPPLAEMTQVEKDAVDLAEAEALELSKRNQGKANFDGFNPDPLSLRGLILELTKWLNKLNKSHKAHIGIEQGVTTQTLTAGTWTQITQFNTDEGYNGLESGEVLAGKANNRIRISKSGDFFVLISICAVGSNSAKYKFAVYVNGTRQNNAQTQIQTDSSGDIENGLIIALVNVPSDNTDITLWCRNTEATDKTMKLVQCQFVVFRNDSINDKALTEIITNIKASIDAGEVD